MTVCAICKKDKAPGRQPNTFRAGNGWSHWQLFVCDECFESDLLCGRLDRVSGWTGVRLSIAPNAHEIRVLIEYWAKRATTIELGLEDAVSLADIYEANNARGRVAELVGAFVPMLRWLSRARPMSADTLASLRDVACEVRAALAAPGVRMALGQDFMSVWKSARRVLSDHGLEPGATAPGE
jgi:hypothetical protein